MNFASDTNEEYINSFLYARMFLFLKLSIFKYKNLTHFWNESFSIQH